MKKINLLLVLFLLFCSTSESAKATSNEITLSSPKTQQAAMEESAQMISAGERHTCALTTSGGVKCWGSNYFGQLGDGTTADRSSPVDVIGLSSQVIAISAGEYHTCALLSSGGVMCWGFNNEGQLGDGSTVDRSIPVNVVGLSSGVTSISLGIYHTCALTSSSEIKCWGLNDNGQLGDGTETRHLTPQNVIGLPSGVTAIKAGGWHTCALTNSSIAKCWGNNYYGQLGNGTNTSSSTPVDVIDSDGITALDLGFRHTCARTNTGGVKCWGENYYGQLGTGVNTSSNIPVNVIGLPSSVLAINAGNFHSCALSSSGEVFCWGLNEFGAIGDGTTVNRNIPTNVESLPTWLTMISAGGSHTCAMTTFGLVYCWGDNHHGQLGGGSISSQYSPVEVGELYEKTAKISAGADHTCTLTPSGGVKCWGYNIYGQLGDGTLTSHSSPVDVAGLSNNVIEVSAGYLHTCARTAAGGVKCWGRNVTGQLGDGTTTDHSFPVDVIGLASGVIAISSGGFHTCALLSSGDVKCWGWNIYGQLGDGSTVDCTTPVKVIGLSNEALEISTGFWHSCVRTNTHGIKCWGSNIFGQLGDGTNASSSIPVDVLGFSSNVKTIALGFEHSCALSTSGGIKCWGWNHYGQLGDGTTADHSSPVDVADLTSGMTAISAGHYHTCSLNSAGGIKCWGYNTTGQLGDGSETSRFTPVDVSNLSGGVVSVSAGGSHTCALSSSNETLCWGYGGQGQLGNNKPLWTPVIVMLARRIFLPIIVR